MKDKIVVYVLAFIFLLAVFGTFFSKSLIRYCENHPPYWPEEEMEIMLKPSPTPQEGD